MQDIDTETRLAISRVSNIIRALSAHNVPLTDVVLAEAYDWTIEQQGDVKTMLGEEYADALVTAINAQ